MAFQACRSAKGFSSLGAITWEQVKVVAKEPAARDPCTAPAAPVSLSISVTDITLPKAFCFPSEAQASASSPIGVEGVIWGSEEKEVQVRTFFFLKKTRPRLCRERGGWRQKREPEMAVRRGGMGGESHREDEGDVAEGVGDSGCCFVAIHGHLSQGRSSEEEEDGG
jgi:hypothetical protein